MSFSVKSNEKIATLWKRFTRRMSLDTNKIQYFRSDSELKWTHDGSGVTLRSYKQRVTSSKAAISIVSISERW